MRASLFVPSLESLAFAAKELTGGRQPSLVGSPCTDLGHPCRELARA